jgi:restriction endonuclease Mrr
MNWYQYEQSCCRVLRKKFKSAQIKVTAKTGSRGGDNGVDIKIEFSNGSKMYAQCKHFDPLWSGDNKVDYINIDHIRAFKWCMERDKIQRGYYFSSVPFSASAQFIAKVNGIEPVHYDPKNKVVSSLKIPAFFKTCFSS